MTNENAELNVADPEVPGVNPELEDTDESGTPDPFEARIAQLEQSNQQTQRQYQQFIAAVGRVQSLSDKLEKQNDPKVEEKVRAALTEVYDVLGTVSDNLDPAILPDQARQRVSSAREAARRAAEKLEREREIEAAIAARTPQPVPQTPNPAAGLEAQLVATITSAGLDPDNPGFNWQHASTLLNGPGGEAAVRDYFAKQIDALKEVAPTPRRPRGASPATAGVSAEPNISTLLNEYADDPRKLTPANRAIVEKYMTGLGVLH